jgi:hypothetical protein
VNGLRGYFTFNVDPSEPIYTYGFAQGGALVCGVIDIGVVWSPGPAGVPYQDPEQRNWGRGVAPGTYRTITEQRVVQPCILLPAAAAARADVFMGDEADVLITGNEP